jgi:hypothetical protein
MIKADRKGKASGLENLATYHRMATYCTFQEVDNIFCLAVGIAVYDELFSCMCIAEFLCALYDFARHTSSRITSLTLTIRQIEGRCQLSPRYLSNIYIVCLHIIARLLHAT